MVSASRRMVRFVLFLLVTAVAAVAGTTTAFAHADSSAVSASCSSVASFSDSGRTRVNMNPKGTTVAALAALAAPGRVPGSRDAFERQVWQVQAQISNYRLDSNGDLRLVLFAGTSYVNAVLPNPRCLSSRTRGRAVIVATRAWFLKRCGSATSSYKPLGAEVKLNGVGFWSGQRTLKGAAPNGAEIHPVIGINPIAGCGAKG